MAVVVWSEGSGDLMDRGGDNVGELISWLQRVFSGFSNFNIPFLYLS